MNLKPIFKYIPEIKKPTEKKLELKTKLKWTFIVLLSFFILSNVPLFGLSKNALSRFDYLAIILGTNFGSIISLGIGPIVMASIILQLLAGSGILNIDRTTEEGKKFFSGLQKLLIFAFIFFEAVIYVVMQGLQAVHGLTSLVIFQLILGGFAIFYMDELTTKWGIGSGVSLFIAAGVSLRLITSSFQFINQQGKDCLLNFSNVACSGKFLVLIQSLINRSSIELISAVSSIIVTLLIFGMVIFFQSLKVEVPLSYKNIRGYTVKWPLLFFYSSVIPVILVAALAANIQLFGSLIENTAGSCLTAGATCTGMAKFASHFLFLGHFANGQAVSGLAFYVGSTNILDLFIRGGFLPKYLIQAFTSTLFYVFFSTIFSIFWVKTSGMDAKSQAKNIVSSGLQVSGFRRDERVIETILNRYIMPLTVVGGAVIGLLAALTNLLGALVSGTAMLLVIMIFFQLYQDVIQQHQVEISPKLQKFMKI